MKDNLYTSGNYSSLTFKNEEGRYLLTLLRVAQSLVEARNAVSQISGGIRSEVWGYVYYSSKVVLLRGIDGYLIMKGYLLPSTPFQRIKLLEIIVGNGSDSNLFNKAYELEYANPNSPQEIEEYAHMCINFVFKDLGFNWLCEQMGGIDIVTDIASRARCELMVCMIARSLDSFGISHNRELVNERRRWWEFRRKLSPSLYGNLFPHLRSDENSELYLKR